MIVRVVVLVFGLLLIARGLDSTGGWPFYKGGRGVTFWTGIQVPAGLLLVVTALGFPEWLRVGNGGDKNGRASRDRHARRR